MVLTDYITHTCYVNQRSAHDGDVKWRYSLLGSYDRNQLRDQSASA